MHGLFVEGLDDAIVYDGMGLAKKIPAINRACGGDHNFFSVLLYVFSNFEIRSKSYESR
jgi:hypothetical protein